MSPAEAKRIIATYAAGLPTSSEDLARATEVLAADAAWAESLDEAFGGGDAVSGCELCQSRIAEFCALTRHEREIRMPAAARHLEQCASCRAVFWSIRPLWTGTLHRVLSEGIRAAFDAAGRVIAEGLAPLPVEHRFVAATAGPAKAGAEWELRDEECGCIVRVSVAQAERAAAVTCSLEGVEIPGARIEVRSAAGALILGGRLSDFAAEPFILPHGDFVVRLRVPERVWEIPISFGPPAVRHGDNSHDGA